MLEQGVLHNKQEMSYLVLASTLVSSLIQPLVGYLSDRKPRPYLMSLGIIVAALGLMFIGLITDFSLLFILLTTSGIGVAIFHPQAGKIANSVSTTHKGRGMSIFSVGGNLGFTAGPCLISGATLLWGLPGIMVIAVPAFIMSSWLLYRNSKYVEYTRKEEKRQILNASVEKEDYKGFAILTVMIFFRSMVLFGLTTFIPTYFMDMFHMNSQSANLNLSLIAVCSALASLTGGFLADRIGFKKVLFYSAAAAVPFLVLFTRASSGLVASLLLIPVAFCIYGTLSVSMVLGQKFLCRHVGFASGITIGLGISFGGLTSPILGYIADHYGTQYTMYAITGVAVVAAVLAFLVPDIDLIRAKLRKEQEALNTVGENR
jgi:FSR family fosmidomycin resistance protein-like MFS transporter